MKCSNNLLLAAFVLWIACFSNASSIAQVPQPVSTPQLQLMTSGVVNAIAVAPDGSIVFGGDFSYVNGIARQNIARLHADGSLDLQWNPGTDYTVTAVAIDDGGGVYVGGRFAIIGGVQRQFFAKLTAAGSVDISWAARPNGSVDHITTSGSYVYVAGNFSQIDTQSHMFLARISTAGTGSVDGTWNPQPDYYVNSIAVDDDGSVFIAGSFTHVGAQARMRLAKLSKLDGAADINWRADTSDLASAVVTGHNGSVYVAGSPGTVGGQLSGGIARLSALDGSFDTSWNPAPTSSVFAVASDTFGHIYAGGSFFDNNIDTPFSAELVAKVSSTGTGAFAPDWNASNASLDTMRDNMVKAIAITDSLVLVGGNFVGVGAETRLGIAALTLSANHLPPVDAEYPGTVNALLQQQDGSIIVGGDFDVANVDTPRHNILRLQPDGTLDPNWKPRFGETVHALASDGSGALYVSGDFLRVNYIEQPGLTKLTGANTDTVEAAWVPSKNSFLAQPGGVQTIAVAPNDILYVGGRITAKVSALNGEMDHTWTPNANGSVEAIALDANNDVILAGGFYQIGLTPQNGFAKVSGTTGALDTSWNLGADGRGTALLVDGADLYIGGQFGNVQEIARDEVARVTLTGTLDQSWGSTTNNYAPFWTGTTSLSRSASGELFATGQHSVDNAVFGTLLKFSSAGELDLTWRPTSNGDVRAGLIGRDGNLYVGGAFTQVSGTPRFGLAALPLQVPDKIFADGFE